MSRIYKSEEGERLVRERYAEILTRWPVANEQRRLPTREGETFVIACGPEDAPPILLFHGGGANSFMWMNDVATWAEHFRLYAVDMIGQPGFSAPSFPPLDSDAYALWLDDVLAGLDLDMVSIVGISLGGWLALDYATRRTDRVASLALLCPAGVGRLKTGYLFKVLPLLLFGGWGRRQATKIVMGPMPDVDPASLAAFTDFFSLLVQNYRMPTMTIPVLGDEALKRLTMPVAVTIGGLDVIIDSDETQRRLEANVPHAEVRYLPERGHGITQQTGPILDFLRRSLSV
jgi:pimeloyl-ACP methyl ester carboxylesterase